MKYKITNPDAYNWIVEEYSEGGGLVTIGKYKGQVKKSTWKQIAYFNDPKDAVKYLLHRVVGDELFKCEDLLKAITNAEAKVVENINSIIEIGAKKG